MNTDPASAASRHGVGNGRFRRPISLAPHRESNAATGRWFRRTVAGVAAATALTLPGVCAVSAGAAEPTGMVVTSVAMPNGSRVGAAQLNTLCGGRGLSPDLAWQGAPAGTRSYAVTMLDPAVAPHGFWHWVAYDIPGTTTSLPAGLPPHTPLARQAHDNSPLAVLPTNNGYQGPCAPPGNPHPYTVTVYALNTPSLNLPEGTPTATAVAAIRAHTLATASLTATFALFTPTR